MSEEKRVFRGDLILVVLMLGVLVGGFWMMHTAIDESTAGLRNQVEAVDSTGKALLDQVSQLRADFDKLDKAHAAAAAPAAPAAPAAKAPAAPAKK